MTNKDLLCLKVGDKIRAKKLDCIFEFIGTVDVYNGLVTSKEKENLKPIKHALIKMIKGYNYPKWVTNDCSFTAREIEKID